MKLTGNFTEIGIAEVGIIKSTINKTNLPEISSSPDSVIKIAANEGASYTILKSSEVGTTKVNILPPYIIPDSISEVSISHNGTTEVKIQDRITEINTTKVNTFEQSLTRVINEIGEVPVYSSIFSEQLFRIHNSIPQTINNIQ